MLKLWGSIAMQDEHISFWSFPIFFEYCIRQETNFSDLIKVLLKNIWKNQVLKIISLWTLEQNIILNKYNCSGHLANVKDAE